MTTRTSLGVAVLCGLAVTVQAQTITVTSPAGGETWALGSTHMITWTTTGQPNATVSIILRRNGAAVGDIVAGIPTANGSYSWPVGTYQGGQATANAGYQVRVRASAAVADNSGTFNIGPDTTTPSLALASPNGGQSWTAGSMQWIVWTGASLTGKIKLELLRSNALVGTIHDGANATNWGFQWKVGQYTGGMAPAGAGYAIRLTSDSLPLSDVSQGTFTIVAAPLAGALPTPGPIQPIQLPDLVVCLRANSHIHVPGSGTVTARVKNIGRGASPATQVRIHFEGDGTNHRTVPPLSPGQIATVGRHEYYTLAGKKDVTVEVDDNHTVTEANENNNLKMGILHRTADGFWLEEPFLCSDGTIIPIGQ
jgi:hypothetical protein